MLLMKHKPVAPRSFAGLVLWLSANDVKTITLNGNDVSQWDDKSGNGNDYAQSTAINQPEYVDGVSNQKLVRFTTTNWLIGPFTATLGIQNSDYEMLFVAKTSSGGADQFIFSTTGDYTSALNPTTNWYFDPFTVGIASRAGAYADGAFHIFSSRVDSDVGNVNVDGVEGGSVTSSGARSSNNFDTYLGVKRGGVQHWRGDIAEVLIYSRALGSSERTGIQNYLNEAWGF